MSWEERMAIRARERGRHYKDQSELLTPWQEHINAGHHWHVRVNCTECSCGQAGGIFTVVFDEDFDYEAYYASVSCSVCGEPGVVSADDDEGGE